MLTLVLCRESSFTGLFRCGIFIPHFDIFCQYCKNFLTFAPEQKSRLNEAAFLREEIKEKSEEKRYAAKAA